MSVRLMSAVFKADIPDIEIKQGGETRKVSTPTMKLLLLAWADHANDDGEGMYPSQTTLEKKTGLSHSTVNAAIIAAKQVGYVSYVGVSRRGTSEYKLDIDALVSPRHYRHGISAAGGQEVVPLEDGSSATTGHDSSLNPSFNQKIKDSLIEKIQSHALSVFQSYKDFNNAMLRRLNDESILITGDASKIIISGLSTKQGQFTEAEIWTSRYQKSFANTGLELEFLP